jgi:NADPH-dependent curcumin reductase CurA
MTENRRIVLAARPKGTVTLDCFRLERAPLPQLQDGQVLLRTLWLSLDPYMRGRMNDAPSYAAPVAVGEVMTGGGVCRIVESRNSQFQPGELVVATSGWQEFAVSGAEGLQRLPGGMARPSLALGVLGMPGFTAFMGLLEIGKPRRGETVVVAAATGAVGSVVGQIAKLKGCRAVGIAGGAEKCAWAVEALGFDACIDHRAPNFNELLSAACPKGIDVYFESVGGRIFTAVVPLLNTHARIPLCGLISQYSQAARPEDADSLRIFMRAMLVKRISMQGFIIFDDYAAHMPRFLEEVQGWVRNGWIKYREDIVDGLENAPQAFLGLLEGRNFGKLLVRVGADDGVAA